jgi:hypothetical protein
VGDQSLEARLGYPHRGKEVTMGAQSPQAATNERIVRLLEEVKAELADSKKREQQIARDLTRLVSRA